MQTKKNYKKNIILILLTISNHISLSCMEPNYSEQKKGNNFLNILYAPWRNSYANQPQKGCAFCNQINSENYKDYGIIKSNKDFIIMLNSNPYSQEGSLMIIPYQHLANIDNLDKSLKSSLIHFLKQVSIILKALGYKKFSFGQNAGRVAGASIPDHMHFHIIPYRNPQTINRYPSLRQAIKEFKNSKREPESWSLYKEIKDQLEGQEINSSQDITYIGKSEKECEFCKLISQNNTESDEEYLVIIRLKHCIVIFNDTPLVQGHMLIIPYYHTDNIHSLPHEMLHEALNLCSQLAKICPEIMRTEGYNLAINSGIKVEGRPDDHICVDFLPRCPVDFSQVVLSGAQLISFNIPKLIKTFREKIEEKQLEKLESEK